jgi:hypothetical protein
VCTDDACDPQSGCVHTDNTAPCDDDNECTGTARHPDVCFEGECVPGRFDLEQCAICRTAGFWGRRGGTSYKWKTGEVTGFNYTQAVIEATGGNCLQVCGQSICGTDAVAPDKGALGTLGSALEALCVVGNDKLQLNQAYRQMVTAALNCVVSGAGDDCGVLFDEVLVGVTWEQCNQNCASRTPNKHLLETCLSQLECWSNGNEVRPSKGGWKCSGNCHGAGTGCNNCHDRGLCESRSEEVIAELTEGNPFLSCEPGQCESLGPAGGVEACKTARQKHNACTLSNPGGCGANLCDVCTPLP